MVSVFKKELRAFLNGMTGAVAVGFLLLMTGIYMTAYNLRGNYPNFELTLSGVSFIYVLVIPVLTMRSVADEKHSKTDQLLYSLPVSVTEIVLAKYFAMVTVLAVPCLVMCFYPLILATLGTVKLGTAYAGILAFFLLGCALTALGMFISSLTESQVLAAVISLAAVLLLNFMSAIATLVPESSAASLVGFLIAAALIGALVYVMTKSPVVSASVGVILMAGVALVYVAKQDLFFGAIPSILSAIAIFDRLNPFQQGLFDMTSVIFWISTAALFMYLTVQSMEKKRWN